MQVMAARMMFILLLLTTGSPACGIVHIQHAAQCDYVATMLPKVSAGRLAGQVWACGATGWGVCVPAGSLQNYYMTTQKYCLHTKAVVLHEYAQALQCSSDWTGAAMWRCAGVATGRQALVGGSCLAPSRSAVGDRFTKLCTLLPCVCIADCPAPASYSW
jgi:hypothetical protein